MTLENVHMKDDSYASRHPSIGAAESSSTILSERLPFEGKSTNETHAHLRLEINDVFNGNHDPNSQQESLKMEEWCAEPDSSQLPPWADFPAELGSLHGTNPTILSFTADSNPAAPDEPTLSVADSAGSLLPAFYDESAPEVAHEIPLEPVKELPPRQFNEHAFMHLDGSAPRQFIGPTLEHLDGSASRPFIGPVQEHLNGTGPLQFVGPVPERLNGPVPHQFIGPAPDHLSGPGQHQFIGPLPQNIERSGPPQFIVPAMEQSNGPTSGFSEPSNQHFHGNPFQHFNGPPPKQVFGPMPQNFDPSFARPPPQPFNGPAPLNFNPIPQHVQSAAQNLNDPGHPNIYAPPPVLPNGLAISTGPAQFDHAKSHQSSNAAVGPGEGSKLQGNHAQLSPLASPLDTTGKKGSSVEDPDALKMELSKEYYDAIAAEEEEQLSSSPEPEPISQVIIDRLRVTRSATSDEAEHDDDSSAPSLAHFEYARKPLKGFIGGYQLMDLVLECLDYHSSQTMLENGTIQRAITCYGLGDNTVSPILLLVLLRLVGSVKNSASYMTIASPKLYSFLFNMMARNDRMLDMFKGRLASDSRVYDSLMAIAFAAHSRPHIFDHQKPQYQAEAWYESHARAVYDACQESYMRGGLQDIPSVLRPWLATFKVSSLAVDTFIDFASGPDGGKTAMYWAPALVKYSDEVTLYLKKSGITASYLRFMYLLHTVPYTLQKIVPRPFEPARSCWIELENYIKYGDRRSTAEMAVVSARFLLILSIWPIQADARFIAYKKWLETPEKATLLLRYALTGSKGNKQLFEIVWALLHSFAFAFPKMFTLLLAVVLSYRGKPWTRRLLIDPCDYYSLDVSPSLAGHAAMFVAAAFVYSQPFVPKNLLEECADQLLEFAQEATNSDIAAQRINLAIQVRRVTNSGNEVDSATTDSLAKKRDVKQSMWLQEHIRIITSHAGDVLRAKPKITREQDKPLATQLSAPLIVGPAPEKSDNDYFPFEGVARQEEKHPTFLDINEICDSTQNELTAIRTLRWRHRSTAQLRRKQRVAK